MTQWTDSGWQLIQNVSQRFGVSTDATSLMLEALLRGNGTMAQFSINELGGGGQWMRGGMTMVGDMFNQSLKYQVDGICNALSNAIMEGQMLVVPQPMNQSFGSSGNWWPQELGSPSSTGGQNQMRYAYFPATRRLAISDGQSLTVYDTLDHQIGGVSQQQGGGNSLSFTSQYGTINLQSLPIVQGNLGGSQDFQPSPPPNNSYDPPSQIQNSPTTSVPNSNVSPMGSAQSGSGDADAILSTIERLAKLRDAGAISEQEFTTKKSELLSRL